MRRALASWASYASRGAHADSVDASLYRCFATDSGLSAPGEHPRMLLTSMVINAQSSGGMVALIALQGPTAGMQAPGRRGMQQRTKRE